jgi:hypothetical protein
MLGPTGSTDPASQEIGKSRPDKLPFRLQNRSNPVHFRNTSIALGRRVPLVAEVGRPAHAKQVIAWQVKISYQNEFASGIIVSGAESAGRKGL